MRIGVFIKNTTLHSSYGGFEIQNKILCEEFAKNGHEVIVYSPKRNFDAYEAEEHGVLYFFINAELKLNNLSEWQNKSYQLFIKHHKQKPFDIVFSQSSAGLGVIRNKNEIGTKVISISHGTIIGEYNTVLQTFFDSKEYINPKKIFKLLKNTGFTVQNYFTRQREFILHSNHVVAVSSVVRDAVIDETYLPDNKISVIHNGITPPNLNTSKPESLIKIVYAGQLLKSKGVSILIKVFKELLKKYQNIELHIIGDGEEKETIIKNANDKIIYHGKKSHDEVLGFLASSHIFVLPSYRHEGFPMSIVEAMFSKMAVISSDVGGVKDAINDKETGILLKPKDEKALFDTIEKLITDESFINFLAINAFKEANERFTSDIMYQNYMKLIEKVLSK